MFRRYRTIASRNKRWILSFGLFVLLVWFLFSTGHLNQPQSSQATDNHPRQLHKIQKPVPLQPPYLGEQSQNESESDRGAAAGSIHRPNTVALTGVQFSENRVETSNADEKKQAFVRGMIKHAWSGYETHAFGLNELKPISKTGHNTNIFGGRTFGATIVDSIDTLYLAGLHKEYEKARDWIANEFKFDGGVSVSVFECTIRFLGGLLSIYSLTKDEVFLNKAVSVADKLLPAFDTPTGIPRASVTLSNGISKNWAWASGGASILSEFGSLSLEFKTLSKFTQNPIYEEKVDHVFRFVSKMAKPDGLYPNYLNAEKGSWGMVHVSVGALGDSFYEYLFKTYLMTGDREWLDAYFAAVDAINAKMLRKSTSGNMYFAERKSNSYVDKFEHLGCFIGGLYAMSSKHTDSPDKSAKFLTIAKGIADTCHLSYNSTQTKIGPEAFHFSGQYEATAMRANEKYYILRPEVIETWFYMWRTTHDPRYRDWAWQLVESLETYCKSDGGYSGIKDVYSPSPVKDDVQQSFFIAETLKYLYLIFSDDQLLPLDEWVFNTEAHPFPVWKRSMA